MDGHLSPARHHLKMETVSVIIPTWNRASTIERAVKSALNQSYSVSEVLVCDDGSTDRTKEILQSIGDDRIKFIEGARAGRPAIPRNRGIAQAKGNWIAFLDSDDAWLPEKIAKQIAAAEKNNCKASCTNAFRVIPGKGRTGNYLSYPENIITFEKILVSNYVICSSALIHKSVIEKSGKFPESDLLKAIEDYALWLRVALQTDFAYVEECLVDYTDDAENSIRADAVEHVQRERVLEDFWNWLKKNPEFANASRLGKIKKSLRVAMKNNGRSFLERIAIK